MLSERATETSPFAAMDVLERASERDGVVHMEVGEPDIEPPAAAVRAAVASLEAGGNGYTNSRGTADCRAAICEYYDRTYGVAVDPAQVVVTPGSSPALLLAILATVDPGDEVVLTDPHYACYPNVIRQAGGRVRTVPLEAADGFQPRPDRMATAFEGATATLLNSPANPTGAVTASGALRATVEAARDRGVTVVADEIYHGLTYGTEARSVLEFADDAIVVDGVSKRFGMTGWRLGWLVAPEPVAEAVNRLAQNVLICAPEFVQDGAGAALRADPSWLEDVRERYRARRDTLLAAAERWGWDLGYTPEGAYYLLLDVGHLPGSAADVADRLLVEAGVALTPGGDFGAGAEDCLRASYATDLEAIEAAIERIDGWLAEHELAH